MTSTPATRTPSIDREDGSHITPTNKERDNDASLVSSSRASTAAEPPHHHGGPPLGRARTIGTITACTLVMMNNMGNGPSFTVTLPDLAKDLGITPANIQWVISAYSLTACFLLLWGSLADMYGRRLIFLIGTFWTGVWGLACGFAPNEIGLDVMRGLQGLGPAAAIPACMGILAQSFPEGTALRTLAFATFSSGAPIGAALGNVLSGFLTQWTGPGWKSALYAQAGLSFLTTILGFVFFFPDKRTHLAPIPGQPPVDRSGLWKKIDWLGVALISCGLVLLTFAVGDGETASPSQWKSGYIIALLIIGVLLIAAFVFWEAHLGGWPSEERESEAAARARELREIEEERAAEDRGEVYVRAEKAEAEDKLQPLLKLSIFARGDGALSAMLVIAFFVWAGFTGWVFFAVLYYQEYEGLGPVLQMIRMLPMSVAGLIANISVAILVARVHGLYLVIIGCLFTGLAPLLFAVIDVHKTYWAYGFTASVLSVFGSDYIFVSGSLLVAKVSLPHEQSLAGGLFIIVTQIGTSIGLSLASVVLDRTIARKARSMGVTTGPGGSVVNNAPREALLAGFRAAQWMNFAYCMLGLVLGLIFLRHIGIVAPESPSQANTKVVDAEAASENERNEKIQN